MTINIEKKDAVTTIILNRAEARNAVNRPMAEALANAFREFDQDDSAKVAVLYGEDTFCAGADLKAVASGEAANRLATEGDGPMGPSRMLLSKPVIAAIEG
ncbi:MAG: enoyl-CoA hydratase-related protein, partial [Ketobacter sp.]